MYVMNFTVHSIVSEPISTFEDHGLVVHNFIMKNANYF
jgi:hypothetical protein